MVITGCNGTAVDIRVDATGAYTAPAVLANITLTGNNGSSGAALFLGPATAAALQDVDVTANTATNGTMQAAERSNLTITNCSITRNVGTALVFAGSSLTITATKFTSNAALTTVKATTAALATSNSSDPGAVHAAAGGALRPFCGETGRGGNTNVANVIAIGDNNCPEGLLLWGDRQDLQRSIFSGHHATSNVGGAMRLLCNSGCEVTVVNSTITNNTAASAPALYIQRANVSLKNCKLGGNHALSTGSAVIHTDGPSCLNILASNFDTGGEW